ncbi:MAG: hypothetical protein NTU47_09975 [Ignavibacteriales bacterium]|nr:hypothetical protein [Ignavibacteriales bacterium]
MKGISNRQKMIVKPRESAQKYVSQLKDLQRSATREGGRLVKKRGVNRNKP